jgi:K+-sensing histidine kinase KdpD
MMHNILIGQRGSSTRWLHLLSQYLIVSTGVLVVTFVLIRLQPRLGNINLSIAYLIMVLVCAAIAHPGVTLFCGLFSFICYDFFLVPPLFTLQIDSPSQVIDPLAFVAVALVTCVMAGRARQRAIQTMVYREADELRATLLHLISHNLRTPLTTIKTALTSVIALDHLSPVPLDGTYTNHLSPDSLQLIIAANQECDRLNRLIGNVLHLSRVDAHALRLRKDWNALDDMISSVFSRWPDAIKDGRLHAQVPDSLPLISFDFDLIAATLTNLVENAFKHGCPPVQVTVSTSDHDIVFCVEDAGNGVPAAEQSHLFEQFSSATSSGIGLGLAVCKGLIEAHDGRIWAVFAPHQTQFYFTLPAVYYQDTDTSD